MKLLLVTEHYWPEQFRITDLAEGIQARGHSVDVLTGMPSYPQGRYFDGYRPWGPYGEEHQSVQVSRVPIIPRGRGRSWELTLNYGSFVVSASLRLLLRRRRPWDVVLVYQPSPVTTALPALLQRALTGIPVAIWVQDLWPESISSTGMVRNAWVVSLVGRLSENIYRRCDRVIGQSRSFVERLAKAGVARDRLEYLPNWAEDIYRPLPAPPSRTEEWESTFTVMFAGNLGRVQALDTVLDAATLLNGDPEIHWAIFGEGALRGWMEEEARRRGLTRVHFLGRRPAAEMPGLFARAGAMLVSLKRDDSLAMTIPAKIQSYLACGRPVLASLDGEGARVVEESGAGFASPAADARGLAENVRRMKQLPDHEREQRGKAARDYYIREFDRKLCLDKAERILSDLAAERR
jgi:glycosyltransferase involved in cell wall biosynthesis